MVTDVGATLWRRLDDAGEAWTPLLRTREDGHDSVLFGVYGDVVYHHGAGFRSAKVRATTSRRRGPVIPAWVPVLAAAERAARYRRRRRLLRKLDAVSAQLLDRIVADPDGLLSSFRRIRR
jgi:hypothetical protein